MKKRLRDHVKDRFDRQYLRLSQSVPGLAGPLQGLRSPGWRLARIPLAILLILGGVFSILPFLGIWMLPLGLLLLAVDIPALQAPLAAAVIRGRRGLGNLRRRFFG